MKHHVLTPDDTKHGIGVDLDEACDNFLLQLDFQEGRVEVWPEISWTWTRLEDLSSPIPGQVGTSFPPEWTWGVASGSLVAPRVRDILAGHAGPADDIQWIPCTITADGQDLPYYIPHFPTWHDILHDDLTDWTPRPGSAGDNPRSWKHDHVPIRWVLDTNKLHDHSVFNLPHASLSVIVTTPVLDALNDAQVAGFTATPARTN
jgi:hypothetical protein